jgi:hypothetical protein
MGHIVTKSPTGKETHLKTRRRWRWGVHTINLFTGGRFIQENRAYPFYYTKSGKKHFVRYTKGVMLWETGERVNMCACGCNTVIPEKVMTRWEAIKKLEAL